MAHLRLDNNGELVSSQRDTSNAQLSINDNGELVENKSRKSVFSYQRTNRNNKNLLDDGYQFGDFSKMFWNEAGQGASNLINNVISLPGNIRKTTKNILNESEYMKDGWNPAKLDFTRTFLKSTGNIITKMTKGAASNLEKFYDFSLNASSNINSRLEESLGIISKEEAEKERKSAQDIIKRNLVNDSLEKIGWNDEIRSQWEKGSIIKSNNIGGQVAEGIGEMVPTLITGSSLGAAPYQLSKVQKLITTIPTTLTMGVGSYGGALEEAYNEGASVSQANKYALGSTLTEVATEWLTGGVPGINDKGLLDNLEDKTLDKVSNSLSKFIIRNGYNIVGEGAEEALSEIIKPYLKNATYSQGEKINWNDVIQSAIVGGITGGILDLPSNVNKLKSDISSKKYYSNLNAKENNNTSTNFNEINQSNINNQESINSSQNSLNLANNNLLSNDINTLPKPAYQYTPSDNEKINNLRQSASKYFDNSANTQNLVNTFEKIIKDKNYNVVFDNTISNENGNQVNAQIKTLDNGETEIRINPNSDRAGEFLIMHEVTHAIETNSMKELVLDYASKNQEFNQALESLKRTYGTEDVSSEVLSDISGQLFGNQEFINNLSMEKPNIFKRIYNSIVSLANKITGNSKESLFIKDLKNKWEEAYRNTSTNQSINNLNNETKYSTIGLRGAKSLENNSTDRYYKNLYKGQKNAELIHNSSDKNLETTNVQAKKETGWFKTKYNDWGTLISDKDSKIIKKLETNKSYKLGEILEHDLLYKAYPELKKLKVITTDIKPTANIAKYKNLPANEYTTEIYLKNDDLNKKDFRNSLLHEINHYIEMREHYDKNSIGSNLNVDSKEDYKNNLGEIISNETKIYSDFTQQKLDDIILPEQAKNNPKYENIKEELKKVNKKDRYVEGENGNVTQTNRDLSQNKFKDNSLVNNESSNNSRIKDYYGDEELDNSSFSFANAKQYDDLIKTNHIEYFRKDNGDVKVYLMDSNNNLLNEFSLWSNTNAIKELGENLGNKIYETATDTNQTIRIGNDINNLGTDTDYFMNHRPSEGYGNASNFEENMPGVFEHPEWYLNLDEKYNKESLNVLKKVRNNPEAELTIYRATIGSKINSGDWVTPSKSYAEYHNNSQFDGTGNILEMKVKAKDIQFAGDDINEFGYFPNNDIKYSQQNDKWQEHLEKNYKATGTRTNMKDYRLLPVPINSEKGKVDNNLKKQTIKEISQKKIDNNTNAINRLTQEKDAMTKRIEDKIKAKKELLKSKQNQDTKLATQLNIQISNLNNQLQNRKLDYDKRIEYYQNKNNKMNSEEFKIQEQRMTKKQEYIDQAYEMTENMIDWKDKDRGIKYKINTMKRNLYDIMPKLEADKMYNTYFQPITENNAKSENFINNYNERISKLELNNKESAAVQMLGEYKYNKETLVTGQQVDDYISDNKLNYDKISNAVEEFRNIYDELIVETNKVLKEQGYKEIEYRKGYFPHFQEETRQGKFAKLAEKLGFNTSKNDQTLPTDIAGMTEIFKPGKTYFKNAQQRKGKVTDYNALKGYDNYIRGAADLIFHTEDIQKLRALENVIRTQYTDASIQKRLEDIYNNEGLDQEQKQKLVDEEYLKINNSLPNFVTELRDYTDTLANKKDIGDRGMEHMLGRETYTIMKDVQSRVSANMVGFNISSALTNFIPITQAWGEVSTKNMFKAIRESIANQFHDDGFADCSTYLINRTKAADRLYKTKLEDINSKAGVIFEGIDSITSNAIVRGKYYDNIDKGMSQEQAIKNANEFAKDIMAGRSKGDMPTIFNRKSPVIKLFTAFQLEVNNQYGYMLKDLPRNLSDEAKNKLVGAFVKMFVGAWLYNKFSEAVVGRKSAFSPIDIIDDSIKTTLNDESFGDKFSSIFNEVGSELPFIGNLFGGGRLPIQAAILMIILLVPYLAQYQMLAT